MGDVMRIQKQVQIDDGWGGSIQTWQDIDLPKVSMWLDMLTGDNRSAQQNAVVEESTHVLIIQPFIVGITDNMRLVDKDNRVYAITYSDNPVGQNHHNEIYLEYQDGVTVDEV